MSILNHGNAFGKCSYRVVDKPEVTESSPPV